LVVLAPLTAKPRGRETDIFSHTLGPAADGAMGVPRVLSVHYGR